MRPLALLPLLLALGFALLFAACGRQSPVSTSVGGAESQCPSIAVHESMESVLMEPTVPVTSDSEIPETIRKRFSRVAGEEFHVAPPGTPSTSDADRVLVFAARSERYFTICYRVISRSMAAGSRVIIASTAPGEDDGYGYLVYVAQCLVDCRNMEDLRKAFAEGKLTPYRPTFIDF
jgi:hypothetical protein